jgi:pimeloyl-ACP methyl ester carboxylesterase
VLRFRNLLIPASILLALVASACAQPDSSDIAVGGPVPPSTVVAGAPATIGTTTKTVPGTTTVPGTAVPSTSSSARAPSTSDVYPPPPDPEPLAFTNCGSKRECAKLVVPLDYANPTNGETITLNVKRRKAASDSVGPLLVNPGGPGAAGSGMVDNAPGYFSAKILTNFDVIGWDPRGTGKSAPVECIDNLDDLYGLDPSPDTPEERAALKQADDAFAQGCVARSGRVLPFISTQESARDMDMIRRALNVEKISYLGFSYGSELGATYATLFPTRVRAMVIDGAVDPTASYTEGALQQNIGFEKALEAFLANCVANSKCPFNRGAETGKAFDDLMAELDANPLKSAIGRPSVNQGVAYFGVATALYTERLWPTLAAALASAEKGTGTGLLDLYDNYTQRDDPDAKHFFDAFIAISCADDPGPKTAEELRAFNATVASAAPHLGKLAASEEPTCWKLAIKPPKPAVTITGKGAGPILVVGTTGDAATPLEGTRKMAASLEGGELLTVTANRHTGYSANACARSAVDTALVELEMPPPNTVC